MSLFSFRIGILHAFQPYDSRLQYAGMDSAQLDSVIRIATFRHHRRPSDPTVIRQLAEAYGEKKQTDSAVVYWEQLAILQPLNDSIYFQQAMLLYKAERFDIAYKQINRSLTISPDNINYLSLSARTAYQLHQKDTALKLSRQILTQDAQNINALMLSGIILRNQKQNEDALLQFDNCLRIDPANTEALLHRAEIYVILKQYNKALTDYSAARADLSTNADVINNLGICYYQSGSYPQAISLFKKAIYINRHHPQGNFNQGIAYYKLNDFDSAAIDMKAASAIWDTCYNDTCHANFLDAIYYLGMCYKKLGDLSTARSHFQLLQKENYPRDLTAEIRHIDHALFISRNWYYLVAVFLLLIALIVASVRAMRR